MAFRYLDDEVIDWTKVSKDWSPHAKTTIKMIERIQRTAT